MGAARFCLTLALVLAGGAEALKVVDSIAQRSAAKGSGLDEVITVLLTMLTDFRSQTSADEKSWVDYQKWAQETEVERTEYIRNQDALVLSNTALKSAKQQDVQRLTGEITGVEGSIADTQKSLQELITMRHEEHTQHAGALADLTKTIDAVNRAIQILEGHYAATGANLAQIKQWVQFGMTLTGFANKKSPLTSLIQNNPDWLSVDGGDKYGAYQKQGGAGGVMGTLEELRTTLDSNRQQAIETEATSVRDFEDQKHMQETTIARLQGELTQKNTEKQEAEAAITTATATIAQATQNKKDGQATLQQLSADLAEFTKEYQERTKTRGEEMTATQSALDALQSVSAGAKEGTGLIQKQKRKVGLMQIMSKKEFKCKSCKREEAKLLSLAKSLHSASLMQVAGELAQRSHASFDPAAMDPVKNLLQDLITRLETEASEESSHEEWCATEKSSSVSGKESREATIKQLQGDIDRFTVSVNQLKSEVTFLMDEIARVISENEEATANRNAAHTAFVKADKDHTEVIGAVNVAKKALGDQYGLLQVKAVHKRAGHKESPFASYDSGSGSAGSASEMLEDLLGKYTAALAQLRTDEQNAVTAFDNLMVTNKQFLADSEATKNAKIAERRGKVSQLANQKSELKTNFVELKELSQYLQDLRPSCDDIRSTFEERKNRREAEIAALKECLAVLSSS